jgi:hypothetical protein
MGVVERMNAALNIDGVDAEQLRSALEDHLLGAQCVPIVFEGAHGMDDASLDPFFAISRKAEVEGYFISGFEANTFDIFGEPVRLVL